MKDIDVAGLTLSNAREKLQSEGVYIVSVKVTAPPKEKSNIYDDSYRVIRTRMLQEKEVELLVCKPL